MPRFIDLDEIAPEPVTVKIAGVRYQLPGDIPVPDYFALDSLSRQIIGLDTDDEDDPTAAVTELHDRLLAMFRVHQPDLEQLPVGPRLLLPLVFAYLNPDSVDQTEEDEADVVPPPRGGTKTKTAGSRRTTPTTRRKPKASGSST